MYTINIFSTPPSPPSDYQSRFAAIDRAKRELGGRHYPAAARVIDKNSGEVVWTGMLMQNGKIVEDEQAGRAVRSISNVGSTSG